jgi:tetratricopeptide (TPR) repeat protein
MSRNIKILVWILVALIIVIFGASFPKLSKMKDTSEKLALRAVREEVDPGKRIEKLEAFLKTHPKSHYRGYAHVYVFDTYLSDLKDTTRAVSYAKGILSSGESLEGKGPIYPELFSLWRNVGKADSALEVAKEALALKLKDSSIYNDMGYTLAEAGEHLDLAIELCKRAVEVAKDDVTKSYAYDSLGWAYFKAGKAAEAADALKQAVKLAGEEVDESVLKHLGKVQLAAGKTEDAIATYLDLMARGQFDDIRAELDSLYTATNRSIADLDKEIKARRARRMSPAPQFSLRDTQGATKALSDYKGKVVLLNFMGPT